MKGHTLFITNDAQLADALPESNCIYLRDVALEWLAKNYPAPCFDGSAPVSPSKNGRGFPTGVSTTSLELGAVQPHPSAKWKRILKDAQTVASAVNESCVFFVLSEKNGRRIETREVLFWHESLNESRQPKKVIKRLHAHLELVWDEEKERYKANLKKHVHGFVFASLAYEKARQNQPGFVSKSNHQKDTDAWNKYLSVWRTYGSCLDLLQTTWLLCEDGATRVLNVAPTVQFLDRAGNVLGWKDER